MAVSAIPPQAYGFAQALVDMHGHEPSFQFHLMGYPYDTVRLTLEICGYSVHREKTNPNVVVAFRCEPDLAPREPLPRLPEACYLG